jgi:hypothetical protein
MALGRPREAALALQPTLHWWVENAETLTVLHEALAQAFDGMAAGGDRAARDSAAAHWRYVVDAWQRGDPPYAARAAVARQRLAALRR